MSKSATECMVFDDSGVVDLDLSSEKFLAYCTEYRANQTANMTEIREVIVAQFAGKPASYRITQQALIGKVLKETDGDLKLLVKRVPALLNSDPEFACHKGRNGGVEYHPASVVSE